MKKIAASDSRKDKTSRDSNLRGIWLAVKSTPTYFEEWTKYNHMIDQTIARMPAIQNHSSRMMRPALEIDIDSISACLEDLPSFQMECRPGVYEDLQERTISVIKQKFAAIDFHSRSATMMSHLASFKILLEAAENSLPSNLGEWRSMLSQVMEVKEALGNDVVIEAFATTVKVFAKDAWLDEVQTGKLLEEAKSLTDNCIAVPKDLQHIVNNVVAEGLHLVFEKSKGPVDFKGAIEVFRCFAAASDLVTADMNGAASLATLVFDAWNDLTSNLKKFNDIAGDIIHKASDLDGADLLQKIICRRK